MKEDLFKSISNITRVRILACLGECDKSVTELIGTCNLSQSALSQHLMYLKENDLVYAERKGRQQIYKVKDEQLSKLCKDLLKYYEKYYLN